MYWSKTGVSLRPIDLTILSEEPFNGKELPTLLASKPRNIAPVSSAATLVLLRTKPESKPDFWAHYRQLLDCANHPEQHYKTIVRIGKTGKTRVLRKADPFLDGYQCWIKKNIFAQIPLPDCAMAYRRGLSIRDNAQAHIGQSVVVKMDISGFFNSITKGTVYRTIEMLTAYPKDLVTLLTALCCYGGCLPQGAATSPVLSNLVMLDFDQWAMDFAAEKGLKYTRYSDDLTFSGEEIAVGELIHQVSVQLSRRGFQLNKEKTRVLGKGACHKVTGIVCNEKLSIPKDYRRQLRQEMHYLMKHGTSHITRIQCQQPFPEGMDGYIRSLMGRINYVLSVTPENEEFNGYYEYVRELMRALNIEI